MLSRKPPARSGRRVGVGTNWQRQLPSERLRRPAPLLRTRMPSKRGAMEQPNARDDDVALTLRFWLVLVATGVAGGLLGVALMWLLFRVQALAFPGNSNYLTNVAHAGNSRRVICLLGAGVIGGVAWYLLRRFTKGEHTDLDDIVWTDSRRALSFRRCLGTAAISEIVIGLGASLGREAAPKLMGGACGSLLGRASGLTREQQRLLIACGGGAGLACVYNVPLGGAFFTAEILLGSTSIAILLPALACSGIATMTAWVYLPNVAIYPDIPAYKPTWTLFVWSLIAGPVIGLAATGYIRLIGWLSHHHVRGGAASVAVPVLAFGLLGLVGIRFPQLFGNGHGLAYAAFLGHGGAGLLLTLALLKPLVTAMCLGSGASGGLFTPVLSAGAMFGAGAGILWTQLWPGSGVGAFAMVAAAATIGSAMQAPLTGLLLVLELTHSGFSIMGPMIAATVTATLVVRHLDGYSIYSARLPSRQTPPLTS
jgi:H+/Cl- antiporter ClcA